MKKRVKIVKYRKKLPDIKESRREILIMAICLELLIYSITEYKILPIFTVSMGIMSLLKGIFICFNITIIILYIITPKIIKYTEFYCGIIFSIMSIFTFISGSILIIFKFEKPLAYFIFAISLIIYVVLIALGIRDTYCRLRYGVKPRREATKKEKVICSLITGVGVVTAPLLRKITFSDLGNVLMMLTMAYILSCSISVFYEIYYVSKHGRKITC